ncbi:cupin domain-containing protein [Corynebacterium pseudokroppenstedtii]|uniref:Cupin domain-containing protein n=1 Tax=Corynebacterium pseudokroppenstedtii TaxID=2804917 RepID=A0AAU0PYL9_9CORY|nr:cupin domain-containing protein [Corynebacterium pseudokroppenstedtii]MBY0791067.1 cupin domain-containing protein [Corynebacterium pseudokroppenstedtii]MCF6793311.1 cupin domain-containing protein [Corynebacterium pseudokroppenstedtii]MCF8703062.1 cupin domain-containing protein [Corynebacterium pseudokroppenstedtii]MCG2636339.1 cupin domain-containing protein [Corynebacterium pseudokroppenstedtii]
MKTTNKDEFDKVNKFGTGESNDAFAEYFVGKSFLQPITQLDEANLGIANVTFEPGCRNNWHIHHARRGGGQILMCTAGEGWYQEEGKAPVSMTEGSTVVIPPNVKHWHGAKADSWFSHIAISVPGEETSNEWLEPVSDEEYQSLTS